jgi:Heterokaryon incompatibility protein (HET)
MYQTDFKLEGQIYGTYIGNFVLRPVSQGIFTAFAVNYFGDRRLFPVQLCNICYFLFLVHLQWMIVPSVVRRIIRDGPPGIESLYWHRAGFRLVGFLATTSFLGQRNFGLLVFPTQISRVWLATGFAVLIWSSLPLKATYFPLDQVAKEFLVRIESASRSVFRSSSLGDGVALYNYENLENGEIRLLRIHPRGIFREVKCEIIHTKLEDAPAYEAISYTWGDPARSQQIFVGGLRILTSINVYRILRDRSSLWRTRCLWIDFICINQGDDEEKTKQVRMMKEIYNRALRVVIWLGDGPGAHLIGRLFDEIELAGRYYVNLIADKDFPHNYLLRQISHRSRWVALWNLISHPYFERVWVIQEIAAARKVDIFYGGCYIDWKLLTAVVEPFSDADGMREYWYLQSTQYQTAVDPTSSVPRGFPNARFIDMVSVDIANGRVVPLLKLLMSCRLWKATKRQDKVFALLGISQNYGPIRVDYHKSCQEVYIETARHLISQCDGAEILHAAGDGDPKLPSLPSWVPDWSSDQEAVLLLYPSGSESFRAAGRTTLKVHPSFDRNKLVIDGVVIDDIRIIGTIFLDPIDGTNPPDYSPISHGQQLLTWYDQARRLATEGVADPYHNGKPASEAFWRTLIIDMTSSGRPAPRIYGENCRIWEELTREAVQHQSVSLWPKDDHDPVNFEFLFKRTCAGRRFCVTEKGFMGLVPRSAKPGDKVCILLGAETPFVLRSKARERNEMVQYELIGEAYVHGIMDGELIKGKVEARPLVLV